MSRLGKLGIILIFVGLALIVVGRRLEPPKAQSCDCCIGPVRESAYRTEAKVRILEKEWPSAEIQQLQQAVVDLQRAFFEADPSRYHERLATVEAKCDKCCSGNCCKCSAAASPFTQQRFAALLEVSGAFSRITGVYFAYAIPGIQSCDDAEAGVAMQKALDQALAVIDRSIVLFDPTYCEDIERFEQIFKQLNRVSVTCWHEYRVWIGDITNYFDDVIRDRIATLEGAKSKGVRMPLAAIPYAQRIKMGPVEYLDAHKKHWERQKKKALSPKPGTPLLTAVVHDGTARIAWIDEEGQRQERTLTEEEFGQLNAKGE